MEPLIIKETEDTPEIILNPAENHFKISKISVPEDAYEFYQPIIHWLKEYANKPNEKTVVELDLEYVNTASSKQLIQVIFALELVSKNSKVLVKWYYEEIDEDMEGLGKRFAKLVDVDFEFIEI